MKDFVRLQSSLLLCVILAFFEQKTVSVGCTSSMFWAVVEPTLLGQGHFLHSDEVSLGIGCPVTNITSQGYEFNYLVTECGIQKEVFSYGVIFYSALHYNIINKGVTGKIPLMCIVSSSPFLDDTPGTTNNNLTKSQDGLPSDNSCPSWTLSNTCLFGLPWIPYFQDSSAKPFYQSLLPKMPHSLVHESANVATF
ncbi:oocyte-secreted protein 3 isoform X2 [Equus asinus]|uniref:oocyte-secreted protein 3 isoform X2 n=2 Tax=Equus asinus TaxID=9793 RepID=UPI0038F6C8B5